MNQVHISGSVESVEFSHRVDKEDFYLMKVKVIRESGIPDEIPVMASENILANNLVGQQVEVIGQFRSHNKKTEEGTKLLLFIFAETIAFNPDQLNLNEVILKGYVCKEPIFRVTPLGRKITDIILAVNRNSGKSDYIPCVIWGRNAIASSNARVGDYIALFGRIQSRKYMKEEHECTAIEFSAQSVEL